VRSWRSGSPASAGASSRELLARPPPGRQQAVPAAPDPRLRARPAGPEWENLRLAIRRDFAPMAKDAGLKLA